MIERVERFVIDAVCVFIFGSAFVGSWALVSGKLPFPLEWLDGTPFTNYVGPAAILAFAVGGSAFVAWILMLRKHPLALPVAFGAGAIEAGWIIGELIVFGSRDQVMGFLQVIYFAAGTIVALLAIHLWWQSGHQSVGHRSSGLSAIR
jgi:hypothetical protein